ncbi:MAG: hypothetical protein IPK93_06660 [Solirubrobacterales bacterium]|nr:hypothetical protein [Solirubrobacterales bacterium]
MFISIAFLVFEAMAILTIGEYLENGNGSEVIFLLLLAVAAAGYFGLGALSGSWLSLFVIAVPVLLAGPLDLYYVDDGRGEIWPLQAIWFILSAFFLIPWGVGRLLGWQTELERESRT